MSTHTTEPMEVDVSGHTAHVNGEETDHNIATFWAHDVGQAGAVANAHLFKAAPKLLNLCLNAPPPSSLDYTNPEDFMRRYSNWYRAKHDAIKAVREEA